jgi:ribonuclease P protein subunit RPR2
MRLLVVDDDAGLLALIRATFEDVDAEVIVLDVMLAGDSGLDLCRELKSDLRTAAIPVVILSGSIDLASKQASESGADAYMEKPFSPLHLLDVVEQVAGGLGTFPFLEAPIEKSSNAQLLLYARDLRRIVELERAQRRLLQEAYGATVGALAEALGTKDTGTRAHSRRVQRYAVELMRVVEPSLVEDTSVECGFLLHDVGKIGISDRILQKVGPLSPEERRVMEQHPLLGYEMLRGITFLQGEGLAVVRSHHERYDGQGYPDRLAGNEIPLAARIFAVADALDAMTSDRPYRRAGSWRDAAAEIARESGGQFDPRVVAAFQEAQPRLHDLRVAIAA